MKAKTMALARRCAAVAAVTFCMAHAGCVSFSIGDSNATTQTVSVTRSVARDAANEIEEVEPVVRRVQDAVTVRFNLHGAFVEEECSETTVRHKGVQMLAAGFFPGSACYEGPGVQVGAAVRSVWYNILFLGLPTVSGLLVEPFVPAGPDDGSAFSQSAIIGFHRWGGKPYVENKTERSRVNRDVMAFVDYSCRVAGASATVAADGLCVVRGVPADAGTIEVTLSVSPRHPLRDQLAPFMDVPITIAMPKE